MTLIPATDEYMKAPFLYLGARKGAFMYIGALDVGDLVAGLSWFPHELCVAGSRRSVAGSATWWHPMRRGRSGVMILEHDALTELRRAARAATGAGAPYQQVPAGESVAAVRPRRVALSHPRARPTPQSVTYLRSVVASR
ncbi:hypothetical protein P3102_12190 [Amycolatopsis sp. QT-25]|uniref:hypothetical protein n=1 Tax=Amycolatopsis sp. QT-25 TaxID=3034022 RepID=UPI0023EC574B|nr:hypothetical protein [Amycolatopsis sp. QT-25]WET81909.1 hypothetical protein P3102_12190 [Amycolatopsis sp. QT-25]